MRKGSQGDHNIQFQKNCNHREDQRAQFHTQIVGEKLCQLQGSREGLFDLILNSASSFSLRDIFLFTWVLNVARRLLFSLDVIAESEDDEGIPSSILPVTDYFVFL